MVSALAGYLCLTVPAVFHRSIMQLIYKEAALCNSYSSFTIHPSSFVITSPKKNDRNQPELACKPVMILKIIYPIFLPWVGKVINLLTLHSNLKNCYRIRKAEQQILAFQHVFLVFKRRIQNLVILFYKNTNNEIYIS